MLVHPETPVGVCAPLNVNAPYADRSARACFSKVTDISVTLGTCSRLSHANIVKSIEFDIWGNQFSVKKVKPAEAQDAIEAAQCCHCSGISPRGDIQESGCDGLRDGAYRIPDREVIQDRGIPQDICIGYRCSDMYPRPGIALRQPDIAGVDGSWITDGTIAATPAQDDEIAATQEAVNTYLAYDDAALMAQAKRLREACGKARPTLEAIQIGAEVLRRSIIAAVRFRESPA